ncbi:type 1 glutamine amidotransferase [Rhodococcoides kyotonense]|nr:type 1 glutamine amidotransferase [Rhodococcus kyotonensis]
MTEKTPVAVVLVHDRDPALGYRNIGTLVPELQGRGYELEVHSFDYGRDAIPPDLDDAAMVVVMGSPDAAYDDGNHWIGPEIAYLEEAVDRNVPILGVCFGGQLLARVLGGTVAKSQFPEHGFTAVKTEDAALEGPWMEFHEDTFDAPAGATVVAHNDAAQQAFVYGPHLGLQFHPEIDIDSFESWADAWVRDNVEQDDALVTAIREDLKTGEADARKRCSALLDAWLEVG